MELSILMMGIPIWGRQYFYIDRGPYSSAWPEWIICGAPNCEMQFTEFFLFKLSNVEPLIRRHVTKELALMMGINIYLCK